MSKTVAIFSRFSLGSTLRELLPSVNFVEVQKSDPTPLYTAEIILADYDYVAPYINKLENVKWWQCTWAGIEYLLPHIDKDNLPKFPITRISGENFGQLMGEHVLATMVFWERNYFKVKENQVKRLWDRSVCHHDHRSLAELTVGILGIGSIGNRIGKMLNYLGATVYGYGRKEFLPLEDEEYKHITKYFNKSTLSELLSSVDYIINVLPATADTNDLLGDSILQNCKNRGTVFLNIGRGNVIKTVELLKALDEKWISGAILDVFETEPLPEDSPLWVLDNVFITPHISGNSRTRDIAKKFKINYERYIENKPLINQVDFIKGY